MALSTAKDDPEVNGRPCFHCEFSYWFKVRHCGGAINFSKFTFLCSAVACRWNGRKETFIWSFLTETASHSLGPLGSLEEEIHLKSFACRIHYVCLILTDIFNLLNNSQSLIVWSEVLHKQCVLQCLGYGILVPSLQDIAGACIIFSNLVCIQSSIHIGWLTFDSFCVTILLMFLSLIFWWMVTPCVTVMLAGGQGWCAAFLWKWNSFSFFQWILLSRLISWDCWIEDNSINYLFKCFNEGVLYYFTDNVLCCQSIYIPSLKKIWLFITVQTQPLVV